jgi:hypothetical protein
MLYVVAYLKHNIAEKVVQVEKEKQYYEIKIEKDLFWWLFIAFILLIF